MKQFKQLEKCALTAAVGLALAGMAGSASAFAPVWNTSTAKTNADVEIWHSGATASTSSLQTAVVEAFCDTAQPVDILEDARTVGKPDFWAVACIGKSTLTANYAGKKVLWNKRDEGGSGVGVGPVAGAFAIGFMMPSTGAGTNCPSISSTRTVAGVSANIWNCTNFNVPATFNDASASSDAVSRVPNIGTSDIEPDKFSLNFPENVPATDYNLDGTRPDVTPAFSTTTLVNEGVAQLIFGVPVNILMYQDLQRAQFPTGHPLHADCNPAGANYGTITSTTANANLEKCMPSLTGNEIRSIVAKGGAIRSAGDFQAETSFGSGTFAALTATGVTDQTIQICRRVKGSGTQAQMNAMLIGYPCDPTSDSTIDTLVPEGRTALTTFVTEGESSGDVEKCLNDFNNGTNTTGDNSTSKKRWAVGVQSLEKNNTLSNSYRFIKIDGFAPTLANAHAGDYYDIGQQSLQYKSGAPAYVVDAFNALKPFIQDPLKLPALNKDHPFGKSGWLATPSSTVTPDSVLSFTRPVAWFRRVSATGKANTCALPSAFKKTGGTGTDITVGPQNCSANGGSDQNCYTP